MATKTGRPETEDVNAWGGRWNPLASSLRKDRPRRRCLLFAHLTRQRPYQSLQHIPTVEVLHTLLSVRDHVTAIHTSMACRGVGSTKDPRQRRPRRACEETFLVRTRHRAAQFCAATELFPGATRVRPNACDILTNTECTAISSRQSPSRIVSKSFELQPLHMYCHVLFCI
jgi:hypothetical protein